MAWYHRAQVGDKVVFVRNCQIAFGRLQLGENEPEIGQVCTIQTIIVNEFFEASNGVGFGLEEFGKKNYFGANLFRPVDRTSKQVEKIKELADLAAFAANAVTKSRKIKGAGTAV